MIWLVVLPAILGCVVVLTDMAHQALRKLTEPTPCAHPAYMYGRCIQCGTPL